MNDLPQPQASRVFIVDDHPIIREYLAQLIEQQPDMRICGEAAMEVLNVCSRLSDSAIGLPQSA